MRVSEGTLPLRGCPRGHWLHIYVHIYAHIHTHIMCRIHMRYLAPWTNSVLSVLFYSFYFCFFRGNPTTTQESQTTNGTWTNSFLLFLYLFCSCYCSFCFLFSGGNPTTTTWTNSFLDLRARQTPELGLRDVPYYAITCYVILLHHNLLYYTIQYYNIIYYYSILYYLILYYIMLYYIAEVELR